MWLLAACFNPTIAATFTGGSGFVPVSLGVEPPLDFAAGLISDSQAEQPVERADIGVKRRGSSMPTYENIEKGHITHGDIVVSVSTGKAETIGGPSATA